MKVCIVTVYNSVNSGSFWQAKALGLYLQKIGTEVYYYKRKNDLNSSSNKLIQKIKILKALLKDGIDGAQNQIKIYKEFSKLQKEFNIINKKATIYKEIDCFILGSDTIWNLESSYFFKNYEIYFGGIFKNTKKITYAASVGNTTYEKFANNYQISQMLADIKYISVRDKETYNIVKKLSIDDVKIVCDPTFLLTKEDYRKIESVPKDEKYIFLYLFSPLSQIQIEELQKFAKEKKLKIINGIKKEAYCDKYITNSPYTFLNYMLYADFVITDTFHGTIFSVNLDKEFISINRQKKKVNDFLIRMNLKDRLINEKDNMFNILMKKVNYNNCAKEKFRKESQKFIEKSLKEG